MPGKPHGGTDRPRTPASTSEVMLDAGMSKTLHSGLVILEIVCASPGGLTISEIAEAAVVHRTVAHRLLRTLEAHRLIRRDAAKRFRPGPGLVRLAEPVDRDLRTLALPVLEDLAESVQATAHLVLQEDPDHVRALLVVEPRNAAMHIAFQPGQLDGIHHGSAGLAILAARPPTRDERPELATIRRRGYATSFSEIIPGVHGLSAAVPVPRPGPNSPAMSIGISVFDLQDEQRIAQAVMAAARRLGDVLH